MANLTIGDLTPASLPLHPTTLFEVEVPGSPGGSNNAELSAITKAVIAGGAVRADHLQVKQTGRYLQRDGTFRDPLLVGTGVLTLVGGSGATITDNTKYNAWPVVCRIDTNRLLLSYTRGDSHHGDVTGIAVCKIGTEAPDGTVSWGSEITVYDDPSQWVSVYGVSQVASGRIFATLWKDSGSASTDGRPLIAYSDDDGATWSTPINVHADTGFSLASFASGPVVELPNGDLVMTVEGYDTSENYLNSDMKLLRSTDGGLTWGSAVLIAGTNGTPRPYYESKLLLLDNGELICIHRTTGGSPGTHYISRSSDGGLTWGSAASAFSGFGAPSCIQTSRGTLIVTTRENTTSDVIAFTSTDRGATWSAGVVLDSATYEMEYACPVELLDGRIMVVYSDQPAAPATNADIKSVLVTEGYSDLRGLAPPPASNTVSALSISSGVVNIDCSLGDYFTLALTANVTSITFSNLPGAGKGASKLIRITQDTTARTVAWPASFKWEGGSAGAVSTGSGVVDLLAISTLSNGTAWDATLSNARS